MAKLTFYHGAMNGGKSTRVIQTAFNYREAGYRPYTIKPEAGSKGSGITTRLGHSLCMEVDLVLDNETNVYRHISAIALRPHVVLVDEAQFITVDQADQLHQVVKSQETGIDVIAYGLVVDYLREGFPGSSRLMELADERIEIPTLCMSGLHPDKPTKARLNSRISKETGLMIIEGDQVSVDKPKENDFDYRSLCGECYEKMLTAATS